MTISRKDLFAPVDHHVPNASATRFPEPQRMQLQPDSAEQLRAAIASASRQPRTHDLNAAISAAEAHLRTVEADKGSKRTFPRYSNCATWTAEGLKAAMANPGNNLAAAMASFMEGVRAATGHEKPAHEAFILMGDEPPRRLSAVAREAYSGHHQVLEGEVNDPDKAPRHSQRPES